MKSIYQMELEDKFNRKIKYREKKLKNQRMIIGKQQEEIERLNNIINKIIEFLQREQIEKGECSDFLIENKQIKVQDVLDKLQELKGSDKE